MSKIVEAYKELRSFYTGFPLPNDIKFDTELISTVIQKLHCGKGPNIVGLSTEHLLLSHPSLPFILSKLFDLIVLSQQIPAGFRHSYIVPVPKPKDCRTKAIRCNDFREIAISPVLSKRFEHCFLDRFQSLLISGDKQFGFKKGIGCSHAIYTARKGVSNILSGGGGVLLTFVQ